MNVEVFGKAPALEADALRAVSVEDFSTFERYEAHFFSVHIHHRRVVQLKSLYQNTPSLVPTESTYKVLGLHLLFLLASDRIADFHTHLEALSSHEQNNAFIKYPVQLERYIMEGNYAKALAERRDPIFEVLFRQLQGVVQAKQRATREETAASTSAQAAQPTLVAVDNASAMKILSNMIGYATDLERII